MRIYDSFLFFNELDILDIRLNLLNDHVYKFVLIESSKTFSGNEKELYFENNKHLFEKYLDKIIHIVVDDTPDNYINLNLTSSDPEFNNRVSEILNSFTGWNRHESQWGREIYQRECIYKGFNECQDDDVLLISDVDEIPNPEVLNQIGQDTCDLKQSMFYYNLNTLKERNWSGTKAIKWSNLKGKSINGLRNNKYTSKVLENGGWHLSFMGGIDRIKDKIKAYSHQEYNNDYILNNIDNNINSKRDLFFRNESYSNVNINDEYPYSMIKFIEEKYNYLLK